MPATQSYISFGITKAEVAAFGSYPPTWTEVKITKEGTLKYSRSKIDITDGEGDHSFTWLHSPRAQVTLRTAKETLRVLEIISGNNVSSSAGGEHLYLGTDGELTPPLVMLRLQAVATDPDAASPTRILRQVVLFKALAKLPDQEMKDTAANELTLEFDCFRSTTDEQGRSIPQAFGRFGGGYSTVQ